MGADRFFESQRMTWREKQELEALRNLRDAVDAAYAGKRADPTCSCPNCRVVRALLEVRKVSL